MSRPFLRQLARGFTTRKLARGFLPRHARTRPKLTTNLNEGQSTTPTELR